MSEHSDSGIPKLNADAKNDASQYKTSSEYFEALEKWMQNMYMWHCFVASFPYLMMTNQYFPTAQNSLHNTTSSGRNNTFSFPQPGNGGVTTSGIHNRHSSNRRAGQILTGITRQNDIFNGIEYQIPPIWKRFVAEFVDFLILFFIKLAVTFVAVDIFHLIDLDKFDFHLLNSSTRNINYQKALEMTSEIIALEGVHRIIVAMFEAFWLRKGQGGDVGGATPGKLVMGIRVVFCEKVASIEGRPGDTVLVYPATDLGWHWALARSFIKNLILAVLVPALFALFFLKHNRTGYDVLCKSIVVEDRPRRRL